MSLPLAVLLSGGGSNLQSLIDHIEQGVLDADIKLVLSNNPEAYGLERARKHEIPTRVVRHTEYSDREQFDLALVDAIAKAGAHAVVLAGFMRILTPAFIKAFPDRVINIHPALLPSFPGVHGQQQAAEYGVKVSGCTVHFVDEKVDHGPIIIQAAVPVLPGDNGDTLGERILKLEHRILPQAVHWFSKGRLEIRNRHVQLMGAEDNLAQADNSSLVHPPLEEGF